MERRSMRARLLIALVGMLVCGCAGMMEPLQTTLDPPPGTAPAAVAAMKEGNRLFAASQWEPAKAQYEAAIKAQPSLAEAHYNLAMVIENLGDEATARKHYVEAANLAPGHKIIWDSPPFRVHGLVEGSKSKNAFISDDTRKH
ncbi:MAG: tetratricopeptide repeat protein [Nitrospiraceae bacterium]